MGNYLYLLFQHHLLSINWTFSKGTLWQKPSFYSKIPWNLTNVNFVKKGIFKICILSKMGFSKCEFCQKVDFRSVNFVTEEFFRL